MPPGKTRSLAHSILLGFLAEQLRRKFRSFAPPSRRRFWEPPRSGWVGMNMRGDVNVRDELRHDRTALEDRRALHEERHAHGPLIRGALVNQPVFPEREAVVAYVNDQRIFKLSALTQHGQHAPDAVIHGEQRLPITAVVLGHIQVGVISEIHTMPGIALVLHPHRGVRVVGPRGGHGHGFVRVAASVALRRDKF